MLEEHYIYLTSFVLLLSVLINVVLFIRLDLAYKFIRYSRLSMAILHIELEKLKHEYESTKSCNGPTEALSPNQENAGSGGQ